MKFGLVALSVIASFLGASAVEVQIFRDIGFKGLIYELSSKDAACIDLPAYGVGVAGSVKTDTCLMVYESGGCTGYSYKVSLDNTDELANFRRTISSFQICNKEFGGDIVKIHMFNGSNIIAEYNDICGCQDLPTQVSTQLTSLNNFGNCVSVYSTSTCSGESEDIPAGVNGRTEHLPGLSYYVRSLSACGGRSKCVKLDAETYKFVIHMNDSPDGKAVQVKLGQRTRFFNNASATLTQEYIGKKTIRETTVVKKSSSFKQFRGYKTAKTFSVDVSVSASIPIPETPLVVDIGVSVGYATSTAYGSGESEEERESTEYTHIEEKEFTTKQTFEVPPCVDYEVSSSVKMVEGYPIEYDVYSLVTGESSGIPLTAEEVAGRVDTMTFVGYHDEYTAIFMTSESISANVGYETIVTGEGNRIPECAY